MNKPSQIVAVKIAEELLNNNLVLKGEEKQLIHKLSNGFLKSADWKLLLELKIKNQNENNS